MAHAEHNSRPSIFGAFFAMGLALSALLGHGVPVHAQPVESAMDIRLHPVAHGEAGPLVRLDVEVTISDPAQSGPFARMAVTANTVPTSAKDMQDLSFSDADGHLPVIAIGERENDANNARTWQASRPVRGAVTARYSLAVDPDQPFISAPQYELRARDGGLSGAGLAFLILPNDEKARFVTLRWDLADAGSGAKASASLGDGIAPPARSLRAAQIGNAYFMAGRINSFARDRFFGAWQGDFAFDGVELMGWSYRLQQYYGGFFAQEPESFSVFARINTLNPGSGIGLTDGFAFTFNDATKLADVENILAHEMVHSWINSLDNSMDAPNGLDKAWFGEGLAVHYQRLLPWRAGLIDREGFLKDLNTTAGRYYTNALIRTPNDEITDGFWKDTRIRTLPYDRGSLYFASVDAKIRARSNGTRSLDDIVRRMLAERSAGNPMDLALWERLLARELGQEGLADFQAMLAGEIVVPPENAFGPCFRIVTRKLRRFDLGFDPSVLLQPKRIVSGLKPGSEAEKAGLRDGDEILNRFSQDGLQGDQEGILMLQVRREGMERTIRYMPRGEKVDAIQWDENPQQLKRCKY